ncbi:MAG: ABC transporter substrate-binding protein [bacterium]|nr:ABC transporter substrate-binding protein [bacterium]
MKKIITYLLSGIIILFLACLVLFDFNKDSEKETKKMEKVKLAEVAHTIFYAPQYVAIEKGYFKEYGIDIDLILASGADKVTAAVLSGDADIGFCGSEATIYVYNGGEKDYLKTFAQLTQKDGTFLVSRKEYKNFKLEDLKGKTIIGGRAGGMPEMTFEYALKQNGIDPKNDVSIDTSVAFPAMSGAFIGGQGDFVTLFEPNATSIEKQGYGHVVASVGELGGVVPYTSYSARISYINNNKELIKKFEKAIQKGLNYVKNHSDKEVAKTILKQFPDTSLNDLESAVKRYKEADTWPKTTKFSEKSFNHLQDIMIDNGVLTEKVSYDKLMYQTSNK